MGPCAYALTMAQMASATRWRRRASARSSRRVGERTVSGGFVQLKSTMPASWRPSRPPGTTVRSARRRELQRRQSRVAENHGRLHAIRGLHALRDLRGGLPCAGADGDGRRRHPSVAPHFTLSAESRRCSLKSAGTRSSVSTLIIRRASVGGPVPCEVQRLSKRRDELHRSEALGPFQNRAGGPSRRNLVAFFCEQYQNIPQRPSSGYRIRDLVRRRRRGLRDLGDAVRGRDVTNDLPLATVPPD